MPRAHEELIKQLLAELTPDETNNGVVYVTAQPIAAGTEIKLPRLTINVEADSLLAFVDREPAANWTHSCRYLLVNCATGGLSSHYGHFTTGSVQDGLTDAFSLSPDGTIQITIAKSKVGSPVPGTLLSASFPAQRRFEPPPADVREASSKSR